MMYKFIQLSLVTAIFVKSVAGLKPVILIPGNGGNQLEVRVDDSWESGDCPRASDWNRLWLDIWHLLPNNVQCWTTKMETIYDPVSRTSHNKPGIHTRVPSFGETDAMEYVDPSWSAYMLGNAAGYLSSLVQEMLSCGYIKGKSLKGAPYDFRFAPHSQKEYFSNLKTLVETTFKENDNTKVTIISHSAGGLFVNYFLYHQDQQWKDQYINSLVALAIPWDGVTLIFQAFTSGYNFDISLVNPLTVRGQQRTTETDMLLLPRSPSFKEDKIFVFTDHKNYSLGNINEYFEDIGFDEGRERLEDVRTKDYTLNHPGVDLHCWYGKDIPTPNVFVYTEGQFPDGQPNKVMKNDGDGMVNIESLDKCVEWGNEIGLFRHIDVRAYEGVEHTELLFHKPMFDNLRQILE